MEHKEAEGVAAEKERLVVIPDETSDVKEARAIADKHENDWSSVVALYVLHISNKCKVKRKLHDAASKWFQSRYSMVTITAIIFGATITTLSTMPLSEETTIYRRYVVATLGLLSTVVTAIIKFLNYEGIQTRHSMVAQKFLELRENIQVQFCLLPPNRQNGYVYLLQVSKTFRSIVNEAPPLPQRLLDRMKTTNPDPDIEIDFAKIPRTLSPTSAHTMHVNIHEQL